MFPLCFILIHFWFQMDSYLFIYASIKRSQDKDDERDNKINIYNINIMSIKFNLIVKMEISKAIIYYFIFLNFK